MPLSSGSDSEDVMSYRAFMLTGGMLDVVVISRPTADGNWAITILQQLPGWGYRVSELASARIEDCVPQVLLGFRKWAGGQITEIALASATEGTPDAPQRLDSGWVRMKEHSFFRMLEIRG